MAGRKALMVLASALAVTAVTATGCGLRGKPGAELNVNLVHEPPSADPAIAEDSALQVDELLFLGLTDYDEKTMEVVPELASRWEVSSDGLVWRFDLRRDVNWVRYDPVRARFEKRRPVTAHDVEYGVKRTLDPKTASPYAYVLYIIRKARPYHEAGIADARQVGVRAVGDYTVEFTLERPAAYFPGVAGMCMARAVPREVVEQYGEQWSEPGRIWTNGPYALTSWEHDSRMTMARNPYYYDARNVSVEKINWVMVSDPSAALAMYRNDELDVCAVARADLEQVKADPRLAKELHLAPYLSTYYYAFNHTRAPFDNRLVRQALTYAIDRRGLVDTVLEGAQEPARSFAGPGIFGSPAQDPGYKGVEYNPDLARKLLAEAGYPGGKGLPEVTLTFNTDPDHQRVAEFVQASWKQVLGVDARISSLQWRDYYEAIIADPPQIFLPSWSADYPDENNWVMSVFHSTRGENPIRWSNAEFDRLVEEAEVTVEPARRKELYARAEQLLCVDEAAIIPLYHYKRPVCSKPYLERTYSPLGAEHIDRWKLKGR